MKTITILLLVVCSIRTSYATHLLGGYIQVKPVAGSTLTYEITATLYLDEIRGTAAASAMSSLSLCFGDGQSAEVFRQSRILSTNKENSVNTYRMVHTYSGPSTYTVSTAIVNRTPSLNIPNSSTEQEPLTLSTTFLTTGLSNQTPNLSVSLTNFTIGLNQRATLSLQATDTEGDSLVYALTRPLTSASGTGCTYRAVTAYQFPNDLSRQGTFKLNSRTGELIWDAPTQQGYFSVAITVSEYRNGVLISQTREEIPLIVVDRPGTPSVIPPYEPALTGTVVTGLPEYRDEDVSFSVFPNPVEDRLQVLIQTSNPSTVSLQLIDAGGRKLHEIAFRKAARQHEQVIGMGSLSPGVYLLQATIAGRIMVQKILKK
ncbi:T9SS type A sorting domain-containing protein [Spirosoma oryzicola]|uniref:T9SS type A sorting domain-containing protein n=1 Tax=Spirosoma oryzicola TaxID=2898794 RepID=UPI001E58207B|nr:T9SS type A sorting domain-containing protein [Spirosoma oryzicola]UHG90860.1 T9SS type A sorting domain-containing protein [Spirosoma oryzicola]